MEHFSKLRLRTCKRVVSIKLIARLRARSLGFFWHAYCSLIEIETFTLIANLKTFNARIDSLENRPGKYVCQRPMPSNYNYELTYECCFLNKEVNKFLAAYQGMWQKYKDILLDCESKRKKNMGRNIIRGEKKKKKKRKNIRTIKNYLFISSRGYYIEKNVWNISGKRSFAIFYTHTWLPS